MTALYLWINCALYVIFAAWMTASPWKTAASVGYVSFTAGGRSEYLVIYGGLQLGLAAFFGWCAFQNELQRTGLVFALCLYVPIVAYRLVTIGRFWPVSTTTLIVGALEALLLVGAVLLIGAGLQR